MAELIKALPWVADGIDGAERGSAEKLVETARWWPNTFNALLEKPWVQDNITRDEATVIEHAYWITRAYRDEATKLRVSAAVVSLLDMPWLKDEITESEAEAVRYLDRIAQTDSESMATIIAMPFLDTYEPEDSVALEALYESNSNEKLSHILAQPVFRDGIDETEIPLAVFVGFIAKTGGSSEKLERLLTPGYANIETQSRGTELSPHMKVSIVRTGTGHQSWIMDAAFDAVELLERVYGLPLPYGHVVFGISHESTCGCTWGFAFDAPLEWDQGKDTLVGNRLQGHIVHELAHSYHVRWEYWMHDGIARVFEHLYGVEYGSEPEAYKNLRGRCEAHDLQMLTGWAVSPGSSEFICVYYLGGELFLELLGHLGVEELGSRLNEIYLRHRHNPPPGRLVGITEVRQVFATESEIVEKHWSGKLNAPENRR